MSEQTGKDLNEEDRKEAAEAISITNESSLEELNISRRVLNALHNAGLVTVQDLLEVLAEGEPKFLAIDGVAEKSLQEVREKLAESGFPDDQGIENLVESPESGEARIEQASVEAQEKADLKSDKMTVLDDSLPPVARELNGEERILFHVTLTLNEQGEPLRTELEHAKSNEKRGFPGFDIQQLGSLIEAFLNPTPEAVIDEINQQQPVEEISSSTEPARKLLSLGISDVQVFNTAKPGFPILELDSRQCFDVRVQFNLAGDEASDVLAQGISYRLTVYAYDITQGTSILLNSSTAELTEDVFEYTPQIDEMELPPGIYRLITLITLPNPVFLRGHYDGPVFRISDHQRTQRQIESRPLAEAT